MRIKNFFFAVLFLFGFFLPTTAHGAEIKTCIDDYYSFISHVRSEKTRNDTFKDFFRAYCQVQDIIKTNDELQTLRDQFRAAAGSCADTSEYKNKYSEILMEQYFIRNIQKNSSDIIDDREIEAEKAKKKEKLERMKKEMYAIFIAKESRTDKETFENYFAKWSSKYDDEIDNYVACPEGPWAEMTGKWNKIVEMLKSIKVEVKKTEFKAPTQGESGIQARVSENIIDFFNKFKEQRMEKVEPPQTVEDAAQSSPTFSNIFDTLKSSQSTYDFEAASADRMARFQIMYGEGGARVSTDFANIVEDLNEVIKNSSTVEIKAIKKSADKIQKKQCT